MLWNIDLTLVDVAKVTRAAYAEAFATITGRPLVQLPQMAGRTEPEVFFDALALNGVSLRDPDASERLLAPFGAELATSLAARRDLLTTQGQLLPGAAESLAAVAELPDVVQSVLTGSSRPNAALKLRAFGLDRYVDLAVGGFAGSDPYPKGALLRVTRQRAEEKYHVAFTDRATVYVADSPRDVEAARIGGARSLAVASGRASSAELRDAGADAVLPDLTDPAALTAFITAASNEARHSDLLALWPTGPIELALWPTGPTPTGLPPAPSTVVWAMLRVLAAGNDAGFMAGDDVSGMAGQGYGATLWEPDAKTVRNARISHYIRWLADRVIDAGDPGGPMPGAAYQRLWEWSVASPGEFWTSIWDYFDVLGDRGNGPAMAGTTMPDVHWFPDATLNYARNALRTGWTDPDRSAIIAVSERRDTAELSYAELAAEVARVARGLRALGVTKGDRVVALLPNIPEAVIGLLAAASVGAIWSSCSPDFGTRSVVDRFAQIEPAVLLAVDGYSYNGKDYQRTDVVAEIAGQLPTLKAVVMVDLLGTADANPPELPAEVQLLAWPALGDGDQGPKGAPEFEEVPFGHPLWVVYSSGTTGLPKPIVHGHGGIVLEHLKALALHMDLKPGDRFTWYTTTGWMMWNFLAGGLLAGTTIVVYDGSATFPATDRLWRLAADERLSYLGTGAPYLTACQKAALAPRHAYDLSQLRGIGSTGSPLPPEAFTWVYDKVKETVQLGSMSGGTDVCTGFVGSCPLLPVRSGVISGRSLGAAVQAFDEDGRPVIGQVGELVLTKPMPSMPVMFWNDPDGKKYADSYFAEFPGVWRHGDWIEIRPDGGCVIYGRSDATLNRGGVRMGTSEFYRVVESFPEVADSLVVDTGRLGAEGRLVLFIQPAPGHELDDDLISRVKAALRQQLSPRHVPDEVVMVPGVPRTLSGKKLEIPVRKILLGTPVEQAADPSALANPEVLAAYAPRTSL